MTEDSHALFKRAQQVMPGGVNSPIRSFKAVGGEPFFVERGEGAYLYDVDGRKYYDYVQSYGASILGHANPKVVEAISKVASAGTTFGAPTELEVDLASEIVARVSGVEQVRFVSSGTEATTVAVRLARGITKRDRVIKFTGGYHGQNDALLNNPDQGSYNVVPNVDGSVAAVIVEPIAGNTGLIGPEHGFLQGLRNACTNAGAILIFDEVITGFRVGYGGASELYGITPDLWCFGKVIGGGLPVGAVAGPTKSMEMLAPTGPVFSAGTLSGNPIAMAAGLATLQQLDKSAYEMLSGRANELAVNLQRVCEDAKLPVQVPRVESLVGLFFSDSPVTNNEQASNQNHSDIYRKFFHAALQRGVFLPPSPFEVLFTSLAHTWDDIDRTTDLLAAAAAEAAK